MSRSYRKPYCTSTGKRSAADDKRVARRCWRHAQNQALKDAKDWDEFLIPVRYEATFNDVWGWGRDGKQSLQDEPDLDWDVYKWHGYHSCEWTQEELLANVFEDFERDKKYYEYLKRK